MMDDLTLFDSLFTTVFTFICAFIGMGNAFVIFSIVYFERLRRNVSNYFIASLAVADFLTGMVLIPMGIYQKKLPSSTSVPLVFCDTFQTIHITFAASSILHLMAISIDRYYRIKEPLKYRTWMTTKRASVLIATIWIASLVDGVSCLMGQKMAHLPYVSECEYLMGDPWFVMVMATIFVFVPSTTLVVIYVQLYRLAVKHKHDAYVTNISVKGIQPNMAMRRHRFIGHKRAQGQQQCTSHHLTKVQSRRQFAVREHRAAVTIGFVLFAYLFCMVPSVTMYFIKSFCQNCEIADSKLFYLYPWLIWFNSGMNPIIYLLLNNDFRKAFNRVFCHSCTLARNPRL
ncbi:Dopamine receptor 1 [Halotydeus destructor]|nr:Dopamine receptor 1 [Halotydeus destructor]